MPAFSHFFLKRLSARSKFSSSWIMTSDKIYFPPSWRLGSPACVQTSKLRRREVVGQANTARSSHWRCRTPSSSESSPVRRRGCSPAATLAWSEPLTALPRSARSRVSSSRSLWKAAYEHPLRLPIEFPETERPRHRLARSSGFARPSCAAGDFQPDHRLAHPPRTCESVRAGRAALRAGRVRAARSYRSLPREVRIVPGRAPRRVC